MPVNIQYEFTHTAYNPIPDKGRLYEKPVFYGISS